MVAVDIQGDVEGSGRRRPHRRDDVDVDGGRPLRQGSDDGGRRTGSRRADGGGTRPRPQPGVNYGVAVPPRRGYAVSHHRPQPVQTDWPYAGRQVSSPVFCEHLQSISLFNQLCRTYITCICKEDKTRESSTG